MSSGRRANLSLLFFLILWLHYRSTTAKASQSREVVNCKQLHRALKTSSVSCIEVRDSFVCNTDAWKKPVVIRRPLNITGKAVQENDGAERTRPRIDWGLSNVGIVAGSGSFIMFRNLIFLQQTMGVGGIDLPFLDNMDNVVVYFCSVVVGVWSCPFPLQNSQIQALPRPSTFLGNQQSRRLDTETIFTQDIVIHWFGRNTTWRFLTTIFSCNVYKNDPIINSYYDHLSEDHHPYPFNFQPSPSDSDTPSALAGAQLKSSANNDGRHDSVIVLILVFGFVAVMMIIGFALVIRQRNRTHWQHNVLESRNFKSQRNPTSKTGPATVWNLLDSDVSLESPLGHGEFGKVYKASWQGTTVAVKIIKHNDRCLKTNVGGMFEAFLAKHISHPNVVQTYQISTKNPLTNTQPTSLTPTTDPFEEKDKAEIGSRSGSVTSDDMFGSFDGQDPHNLGIGIPYETWIVLEYCDGGSLADAISSGDFLAKSEQMDLVYQISNVARTALEIAGAMNYLHSVRIIHGDLKPGNVLLKKDASDPRGFICKVGDFGLSRFLAENSHIETFTCGTVTHMPPELLQEGMLTSASDVYSFGILLWEIMSGKKPFFGKTQAEVILSVINKQARPIMPPNVPIAFAELITSCWHQDYAQRPIFPTIIDTLTTILQDSIKSKKSDVGARPPPGALDTAIGVMRSSFFISGDTESAQQRKRRVSFCLLPKQCNSMKNRSHHQLHNHQAAESSTDALFMDTNISLHLSLDGQERSTMHHQQKHSANIGRPNSFTMESMCPDQISRQNVSHDHVFFDFLRKNAGDNEPSPSNQAQGTILETNSPLPQDPLSDESITNNDDRDCNADD